MTKFRRMAIVVSVLAVAVTMTISIASAQSDNHELVLNKARIFVDEASGKYIRVKLSAEPSSTVTVSLRTPDRTVFTLPNANDEENLSFEFDSSNWDSWQRAYIWAVQDTDRSDELESAVFTATGYDTVSADVVVLETQSDTGTPTSITTRVRRSYDSDRTWGVNLEWQTGDENHHVYRLNISDGETTWTDIGTANIRTFFDKSASRGINLYRVGTAQWSRDPSLSRTVAVYFAPPGGT